MNKRRRLTGVVTSNKMDKTVVVEVSRSYRHRLYKKVVHERSRYMAHDELGCEMGDHVRIVESMPISRKKRWVVEEILRHDIVAGEPELPTTEEVLEEVIGDIEGDTGSETEEMESVEGETEDVEAAEAEAEEVASAEVEVKEVETMEAEEAAEEETEP